MISIFKTKFFALTILFSTQLIAMNEKENISDQDLEKQEEYQDISNFLQVLIKMPLNYIPNKIVSTDTQDYLYAKALFLFTAFSYFRVVSANGTSKQLNILNKIIENHLKSKRYDQDIISRGYCFLKINDPKSILIDFDDEYKEIELESMNLAKILFNHGANYKHTTQLHRAAIANHVNWIKFLVSELNFDVDYADGYHLTPLIYAIENNNFEATEKLIELGANVNYGAGMYRPLAKSATNKNLKITKLLLKNGAKLNDEVKKDVQAKQDSQDNKAIHPKEEVKAIKLKGCF